MRFFKKINLSSLAKNKKIFIITCLIATVAVSSVCGILAYYTDAKEAKNDFTVGQVNVVIEEEFNPPKVLEPGTVFTKKPIVLNNGNMECYVRAKIAFSDESVKSYTSLDLNTEKWIYNNADGYYYYTQKLGVNERTIAPFTQVSISNTVNPADVSAFELFVYAEAVEARDFTDYMDAWEYFNN